MEFTYAAKSQGLSALVWQDYSGFLDSPELVTAEAGSQTCKCSKFTPSKMGFAFPSRSSNLPFLTVDMWVSKHEPCMNTPVGTVQVKRVPLLHPSVWPASALDCLCLSSARRFDLLQHSPQLKVFMTLTAAYITDINAAVAPCSPLQSISIILLHWRVQCWCWTDHM